MQSSHPAPLALLCSHLFPAVAAHAQRVTETIYCTSTSSHCWQQGRGAARWYRSRDAVVKRLSARVICCRRTALITEKSSWFSIALRPVTDKLLASLPRVHSHMRAAQPAVRKKVNFKKRGRDEGQERSKKQTISEAATNMIMRGNRQLPHAEPAGTRALPQHSSEQRTFRREMCDGGK